MPPGYKCQMILISLVQEYQARLTLLHVLTVPQAGDLVQPLELEASSRQLLRNLVPPEAELWCVPDYVVERGAATERILEIAAQRTTDLIVLGVRQPSGFPGGGYTSANGNCAQDRLSTKCPVLTVRA